MLGNDGNQPRLPDRIALEYVESVVVAAPTADARGRALERACTYLLRHAPEGYGLAEVWPWRDWPGREAAGFGLQDLGVDLVAQTRSGQPWAIQAKFRTDPAQTLTWERGADRNLRSTSLLLRS